MSDFDLQGDVDASLSFLAIMQPKDPWSLTALDPDGKAVPITKTFDPSSVAEARRFIEKWNGRRNIYFSVNPVRTALTKKAKKSDIRAVAYFQVDIDPRPGHDLLPEQERILDLVTNKLPIGIPPPTAIVFSGGGYQLYWKLKDIIPLDGTNACVEAAERWSRLLAQALGGDNCHNADRIMRLPGTINLPSEKKKAKGRTAAVSYLVEADWTRSYSLDEFPPPADETPPSKSRTNARKEEVNPDLVAEPLSSISDLNRWNVPERIIKIILEGFHPDEDRKPKDDRSRWVFDVASGLIRCGVPHAVVLGVLTDVRFKISEHVLEKPNPITYAKRQIERALAIVTESGDGPAISSNAIVISGGDPRRSARLFLQTKRPHLLYIGGSWLDYEDGAYHELEEQTIRADLYAWLETTVTRSGRQDGERQRPKNFRPTASKVSNVLDALRAQAHLPSDRFEPPTWLEPKSLQPNEMIACLNGLLHLPTSTLMSADPKFFTRNALQFAFDPDAPPPTHWLAFLQSVWGDGPEIGLLQEVFGYCIVPDTSQQKIFLLVGPKRSGKGTIAAILTLLIGERNVCSPSLNGLSSEFGLQPLVGKQLAIASDMRLGYKADLAAIAENLLRISGEDGVTINRKHKDYWTGRLMVRFVIMSNEMPRLPDGSAVLASRFIPLVMERSFFGQEDLQLKTRLMEELPSILNWSIEGWRRLTARGHFLLPEASRLAIEELEDMSTPVRAFLRERCQLDPNSITPKDTLWEAWRTWCGLNNETSGNARQFFKNLVAASGRTIRGSKPNAEGRRIPSYVGIRVLPDEAPM